MYQFKPLLGVAVALALVGIQGPATEASDILGSALINRTFLDSSAGQVIIYAGGFFDNNLKVNTFSIFGDGYSGSRVITPILFEQTSAGVFTVRGVGTGRTVASVSAPQSFDFGLQFGIDTTTNSNFTFGFIQALVNSSGSPTFSSLGSVDWTNGVSPGQGVGGPGTTNRFVFTPSLSGLNVALGRTFGLPGTTADFILNNPNLGGFEVDRTYSTTLSATPVPEPATLWLVGLAGIAGMVVLRNRRTDQEESPSRDESCQHA